MSTQNLQANSHLRNSQVNLAMKKEKMRHWNCIRWVCHIFWHSIYSSKSSEGSVTCWLFFLLSVIPGMHFISPSSPYHKMLRSRLFPFRSSLLTMLLTTRQEAPMTQLRDIYSESWINPGPKRIPTSEWACSSCLCLAWRNVSLQELRQCSV